MYVINSDKGSEKLVKKIASIVIKDPEGWLSTTEVNQQEFVKKLLMWTNTGSLNMHAFWL